MKNARTTIDSELLVAQYGWVRTVARNLVRDRYRAEDVAQETLLAALVRTPPDVADEGRMRAWLGRVAFNLSQLSSRQNSRRLARERRAARAEALASTLERVESASVAACVSDAVSGLKEPYRTTVELRYYEGLSTAAIAARTGTSEIAVRKRLWRARGKLRESLMESFGLAEAPVALAGRPRRRVAMSGWLALGLRRAGTAASSPGSWSAKLAAALLVALGAGLWFGQSATTSERALPDAVLLAGVPAPALAGAGGGRQPLAASAGEASSSRRSVPPWTRPEAFVPQTRVERGTPPRGAELVGLVLGLDGAPLAGFSVIDPARPETPLGESANDGSFRIPQPGLPVQLCARSAGFAPVLPALVEEGMQGWSQLLVAAPARPLHGRVVDEGGAPLPGARLEVLSDDSAWVDLPLPLALRDPVLGEFAAGSEGAFALAEVPLAQGFFLRVSSPGHESELRATLALEDGETLVLRRTPETALVCGTVHRRDGQPAAGAHVRLGLARTRADEGGYFRLAPRGALEDSALEAWEEGATPARIENFGARLSEGWPGEEVALVLGERLESIRGRLLDSEGRGEDWSVAAFALLGCDGAGPSGTARVEADGAFLVPDLRPGSYALLAFDPAGARLVASEPVSAGAGSVELLAGLPGAGGALRARLLADDGTELAGARVTCALELPGPTGLGGTWRHELSPFRADRSGRFELRLSPGASLALAVEHPLVGEALLRVEAAGTVELAIPRPSHLRIFGAGADEFSLLDGRGQPLAVRGPVQRAARMALHQGRSPWLLLPAETASVRLLRAGSELATLPLELEAGQAVLLGF
jgi:RNA polymerase sigma-70 factor (ECF subfamily)